MFWFKLALALGIPVAELQERVNAREFAEWLAYDKLQPIGPERHDWLTAQICHTVLVALSQAFGGKAEVPELKEFVLKWAGEAKKQQTPEEIEAVLRTFFGMGTAMGAK